MKKEKQFPSYEEIRSISEKALPILDSLVLLRHRHYMDAYKTGTQDPIRDREYELTKKELYKWIDEIIMGV